MSGSQSVSARQIVGILSRCASATAFFSRCGSITITAPGRLFIVRMPSRLRWIFASSRFIREPSFFEYWSIVPLWTMALQFEQPVEAQADRPEIRQRAAEPALDHEGHPAADRLFLHHAPGLALRAHEDHRFPGGHRVRDELAGGDAGRAASRAS